MHKRTCWIRRAELALAEGDPTLALEITERLIATAPGLSLGAVITWLWRLKGEALAALGRVEEAHALLLAAAEHAQASEERFHRWRIHASLGRLNLTMGHRPEAEQQLAVARASVLDLARTVPAQTLRDDFVQTACRRRIAWHAQPPMLTAAVQPPVSPATGR